MEKCAYSKNMITARGQGANSLRKETRLPIKLKWHEPSTGDDLEKRNSQRSRSAGMRVFIKANIALLITKNE